MCSQQQTAEADSWGERTQRARNRRGPQGRQCQQGCGRSCRRGPGGPGTLFLRTGGPLSGGFRLLGCSPTCLHGHHRALPSGGSKLPARAPGARPRWPPSDLGHTRAHTCASWSDRLCPSSSPCHAGGCAVPSVTTDPAVPPPPATASYLPYVCFRVTSHPWCQPASPKQSSLSPPPVAHGPLCRLNGRRLLPYVPRSCLNPRDHLLSRKPGPRADSVCTSLLSLTSSDLLLPPGEAAPITYVRQACAHRGARGLPRGKCTAPQMPGPWNRCG